MYNSKQLAGAIAGKTTRRRSRLRVVVETCTICGALLEQGQAGAFANEVSHAPATQIPRQTTQYANDVGCAETVIPDHVYPGVTRTATLIFKRPPGLQIEDLSDEELRGCGLTAQGAIRKLPDSSLEHQEWLSKVRAELAARQLVPGQQRPRPGTPEEKMYPPPPPPLPSHLHGQSNIPHSFSDMDVGSHLLGSVGPETAPINYYDQYSEEFAGREIDDTKRLPLRW